MVVDRSGPGLSHSRFADLGRWLPEGGLLVINDVRVVPARLWGRRNGGGVVETMILRPPSGEARAGTYDLECLARPARRLKPGDGIEYGPGLKAEVLDRGEQGRRVLRFFFARPPVETLETLGRMPLPPYIKRDKGGGNEADLDRERYQTVYAARPGAVAAPTAGLHFTPELIEDLKGRGFETAALTLFVGYGTFAPVRVRDLASHRMHSERMRVSAETAEAVRRARDLGRPVIAVGTTVVRTLESLARTGEGIRPYEGETDLFIYPGFEFRVVDHLVTNFHLPGSTLLMLVAAFAGRERILDAYRTAVQRRYRFFSYGDAMLIR